MAAIDEMDKRYPELELSTKWQEVKTGWQALKSNVSGLTPQESFQRHTALIDLQIQLIAAISDHSNITYDPTVDGYSLGIWRPARCPA